MGAHTINCRETGEPLANKLDGGTCVCKPGECEMRKLRNGEGDYSRRDQDNKTDDFDTMGFAIGLATGFPISPRGITLGSIVGSLLHPTERHAAYDVTSPTPTIDTQPGTPAAPVRDVDFNDNSTSAQPIDNTPVRNLDMVEPSQSAPSSYSPPPYEPPAQPTYAPDPPQPSYSPPAYDPPPSYSQPAPTPDPTPSYTPDPSPSYSSPSYDSSSSFSPSPSSD